ncbi:MAG TPA: arginase family protein, partial [Taishania sp.]|nr:arginase family protein [Taishania sp.]
MENIKFIINRSEIAAGTRGASLGPESLKVVAWKNENSLFGDYPIVEVPTANHLLNKPVKHQFAKRIEGLIEVYKNVAAEVVTAINENTFPLVLAGDHASAGGTIAGLKAAYPDKRLGVIWVDAHGDLHTPYTTPSGNMHGMPLSTALNDDNLSSKRNDVPNETVQLWEKLKAIGFEGQKVKPEDLIFVGVRDVEDEEISMMNRLNIRNFTVDEVRLNGAANIANEINQLLSQC